MDEQIIKRFKSFQREADKYLDLDFSLIKFELVELGDGVCDFPALTRVTGGVDLKYSDYQDLNEDNKKLYVPLISGTVENNQISGWINKTKISNKNLCKSKSISWTRINPKCFFIQEDPVCTNDDSFVMEPNEFNYYKYIKLAIEDVMSKIEGLGWSNKVGKNAIKEKKIQIPLKINETYTSLVIQKILVEFIEYYADKNEANLQIVNNVSDILIQIEKAVLPLFFQNHESVSKKFDRYCIKNKINLKLSDIEFVDNKTQNIGEFKGGNSKLTKEFMNSNLGQYPVYSAATDLKTKGVSGYISSFMYEKECIHITKNGEKTGTIFFIEEQKHSINGDRAVFLFDYSKYNIKYIYYCLKSLNLQDKHDWGNKLSKTIFYEYKIPIPNNNTDLSSLEIQKNIADFTENYLSKINTMKSATEKLKTIIAAHSKTIIFKIFNS